MSYYQIKIDDEAVTQQIRDIINTAFNREIKLKYSDCGKSISEAVKEVVYSRKDEIIEMIVDKAVKELVRKGLPKLIERFEQ